MSQPASRLITLIMLLQRQPNQKAAVLAKNLGVSVRTLHRYFGALDEMGIPIYTERGPHGGFSLVRGYRMPPLVFSPEEAASLYLGTSLVEEIWGTLYRDAAASALAKLENVLPGDQQREVAWARRSMVATGMRHSVLQATAAILEILRLSIKELKGVRINYLPGSQQTGGGEQLRDVDPYALVHRWGWWYMVGFCHLRGDLRSFRVDRIREVKPNGRTYEIPPDFDIHVFLQNTFHNESNVTVTMRFAPETAQVARANQFSWEKLEEKEDGSVEVCFSVADLAWAASAVLGYGPSVRVLDPPELITTMREWTRTIAAYYEQEQKEP
jgi:predicted DNA-binding transcriptional regulator YafY